MKRWMPALVVVLAGLGSLAPAHAQTTLRYKFKQGSKLDYTLEQKMKMSQDVGGNNIQTSIDQTMDMSWKVESVDDKGAAKIKIVFQRAKMVLDTPMGKVEVDSDSKEEPDDPIGKVLYPLIKTLGGLEMTLQMDATGKLRDAIFPEKLAEKIKAFPGMGDMFSEDALKKMAGQNLVFPEKAVKKGDTWNDKMDLKMPFGKLVTTTEYTYQGPTEKNGATLEMLGLDPKLALEPDPNAKIAMKLKSAKTKGTVLFDNKAGRLVQVDANQNMVMEIEVNGMTIGQTIDSTTVLKLKKAQ